MKRFRSRIQSIYDMALQQSRIAALQLGRCKTLLETAERNCELAAQRVEEARQTAAIALSQACSTVMIRSLHSQIGLNQDRLVDAERDRRKAQEEFARARAAYEELKTREERLSRLIDRQKAAHRKVMLAEQQVVMDEASAARRARTAEVNSEGMLNG